MKPNELTIGRLAKAANVGIETIRYYQRQELLPEPPAADGAFRHYPISLVERIRFIKRAQELGFTLSEIGTLLKLGDGTDRRSIRKLAADRLTQIRAKLTDLRRMEKALEHALHDCEGTGPAKPCPIIAACAGSVSP
ncbi:MAG: MerR family DNA-binding protein [Betaproteobacteria bacterium]|nr:MerR family DNA-binding protein [Betaproteobacteria bacterium]